MTSKENESKGNNKDRRVVLSAGGTGGHMFPAAALASDLRSRGYKVELITDSAARNSRGIFRIYRCMLLKPVQSVRA